MFRPLVVIVFLMSEILLGACSSTKEAPTQTPAPEIAGFADRWMLFDDVRSDSLLGVGFDPSRGAPVPDCYTASTPMVSKGRDLQLLTWDRTRNDKLTLSLFKLLGVDLGSSGATRGTLRLDSVVTVEARIAPSAAKCTDITGLFPRLPGVHALYGVQRYTYTLKNDRGGTVKVNASELSRPVDGSVGRVTETNDSTEVSFTGLRWIGYRLTGFERGSDSTDSWEEDPRALPLGGDPIDIIQGRYTLYVEKIPQPTSDGQLVYRVTYKPSSRGAGGRSETIEVRPYEAFPLITLGVTATPTGTYYEVRLFPDDVDPDNQVRARYHSVTTQPCLFSREADSARAVRFLQRSVQTNDYCGSPRP